jgi:predicted signal transduction protein with EAL and GGDEF domain
VARLGSDEFAMLLPEVVTASAGLEAAQRLRQELMRPVQLAAGEHVVNIRVGAAVLGAQYQHPDEVLRDAEMALASTRAETPCLVFDADLHRSAAEQERLTSELRQALEQGKLRLVFQPVVHLGDEPVQGIEAVLC